MTIDTPIHGGGYQLVDSMTSPGRLHPMAATLTISFEAGPRSLTPVTVKGSMDLEFSPDPIPESVYLIYPSEPSRGLSALQPPIAAAFVLRVLNSADPSQSNLFLVTARHAVDPRWANCAEQNPRSVMLRLNRRIGGVGYETVQLQSGSKSTFFTSSDLTVDLALISLDMTVIANLRDYRLLETPADDLLVSSDLHFLHKDLLVRTARYSDSLTQEQDRYPIRNLGSISEIRDDVTDATDTTDVPCNTYDLGLKQNRGTRDGAGHSLRHLWSIKTDPVAGLIGAPVFVNLERVAGQGRTPLLLGVQSDIWSRKGIVGITPSYLIGDIVRSALWKKAFDQKARQGTAEARE